MLNELQLESTRRDVTSYGVALAHIGLNEKEDALCLNGKRGCRARLLGGCYAVAPELDDLCSDPRFKEMLKRLNLPE